MIQTIKKVLGVETQYLTPNQIRELSKVKTYHKPYNKVVLSIALIFIVGCLVTPFTNLLIIPISKLTMRYA